MSLEETVKNVGILVRDLEKDQRQLEQIEATVTVNFALRNSTPLGKVFEGDASLSTQAKVFRVFSAYGAKVLDVKAELAAQALVIERMREALAGLTEWVKNNVTIMPCDHDVGDCWCDLLSFLDRAGKALSLTPKSIQAEADAMLEVLDVSRGCLGKDEDGRWTLQPPDECAPMLAKAIADYDSARKEKP